MSRLGPLSFPNPVGLAGGFDKNAVAVKNHSRVWFWFHRDRRGNGIGATRQSQTARFTAYPRTKRSSIDWGFNNEGATAIAERLRERSERNGTPAQNSARDQHRQKQNRRDQRRGGGLYLCIRQALSIWRLLYTQREFSQYTHSCVTYRREICCKDCSEQSRKKITSLAPAPGQRQSRFWSKSLRIWISLRPTISLTWRCRKKSAGIIATNATAFLRETLVSGSQEPGG